MRGFKLNQNFKNWRDESPSQFFYARTDLYPRRHKKVSGIFIFSLGNLVRNISE